MPKVQELTSVNWFQIFFWTYYLGTTPVVKNLSSSAGDVGSIPGQETKTPQAAGQLSPGTATREPASQQRASPAQKTNIDFKNLSCKSEIALFVLSHLDTTIL